MTDPVTPPLHETSSDQMEDPIALAKAKAAELVTEAVKTAEEVVRKATGVAEKLLDDRDERTTQILSAALKDAFGENLNAGRFIDITKVPLLCQSVIGIHADIKELKEMMAESQSTSKDEHEKFVTKESYAPVRNIVFGMVGLILTAFMTGLIILVFRTQ